MSTPAKVQKHSRVFCSACRREGYRNTSHMAAPTGAGLSLSRQCLQVKPRKQPQSIGCGKTFRGASALKSFPTVHTWLVELGKELEERVAEDREEHARLPRLLTVVSPGPDTAFFCDPRASPSSLHHHAVKVGKEGGHMGLKTARSMRACSHDWLWHECRAARAVCLYSSTFWGLCDMWSAAVAAGTSLIVRIRVWTMLTWMLGSAGHVGRRRPGHLGRQHLPLLPTAPPRGSDHGRRRLAVGDHPQSRQCNCCCCGVCPWMCQKFPHCCPYLMHFSVLDLWVSRQRPVCKDAVQIKRWAGTRPGWAITSLFMTASKFDSAPTGSSQITRFLRPKGSPAPAADSASASTAHAPPASASVAPEHWLQSSAAASAHAASGGAQPAAAPAVPAAGAPAASSEAQASSAASRPVEPKIVSGCPVDAQTAGSRTGAHAPGPTTMAQGLAMSMQGQSVPGPAAAGALLPASAAPRDTLHTGSTERTPGASTLADLGSSEHCPPAQCAEGADEQEWSEERRRSLVSNVPRSSSMSNMAEASEVHSVPVQQQSQSQRVETEQHYLIQEDQQVLPHGEAGNVPEHASSAAAPWGVVSSVRHLSGKKTQKSPQETSVIGASSAWPAQRAAPQPDADSSKAQEGDPSGYGHLSQEVCTSSTAAHSREDLHTPQLRYN